MRRCNPLESLHLSSPGKRTSKVLITPGTWWPAGYNIIIIIIITIQTAGAKASFESISVIHVYSLQPNTLQDLHALLDVNREILSSYGHEDPLEYGKQWGMIQNEHVKRRKTLKPPPPAAANAAPRPSSSTQEPPQQNETDKGATLSKLPSLQKSEEKAEKPPAQRKKGDLFSSFAKAKPKAKTEEAVSSSQTTFPS